MKKLSLTGLIVLGIFTASNSQNLNVTLAAQLVYPTQSLSNICGWVDTADGKEYALVGAENGLSIVDISTPSAPVEIVQIPGPPSTWREIKVNGDYAYVTTESGKIGLQIVQLTNLPSTSLPVATWRPKIGSDTLNRIHALHIDNGKVYIYGSNVGNQGAIIADITTNPMAPIYLGSWDNRYIHDGYVRGDTLYACHIYDGDCEIVDLRNPAAGVILGDFTTPGLFTHNSWLSANSKICFTTDEVSDSYLTAYDVSTPSSVFETDRIQSNPGSGSYVHNTHIIQKNGVDYAVTSWYLDGFTIVDAGRPGNLVQVGNYDTSPTASGPGEDFDWGVYPFFPSGTIVASDMQNGLFVFTPNYVRACYLEGVVKNCTNGNPVSGVNVEIKIANPQTNANKDITDAQGQYAVGVPVPNTYLAIFSKIGFYTDTDTVILAPGVLTLDTILLCPLPTFSFMGHIFDNSTTSGILGARVSVYNASTQWDTITDASGNFTIPAMFTGTYTISSGKWGYVSKCLSSQNITSSSGLFNLGLNKGIYDDFSWDWGWTASGSAALGIWERGEPLGTYIGSTMVNPEYDISSDCGDKAFVTGNNGMAPPDDEVDGTSILTSPVFDLSTYTEPYVFFSRWKYLAAGTSDSIRIMLSNGSTTVSLENIIPSSAGKGQWINRNYKISSLIPVTSTMQLIVYAVDNGTDDIVEAGIDKFYILDSTQSSVNELANPVGVGIFPNPFHSFTTIQIQNAGMDTYPMDIYIYDVIGQERKRISVGKGVDDLRFDRGNLSSGIYFYKIIGNKNVLATGKLCIE